MMKIFFKILLLLAGVFSIINCSEKKKTQASDKDALQENGILDSTIYGKCGENTAIHTLELITLQGDTANYVLGVDIDIKIQGGLLIGDKLAVIAHKNEDGENIAKTVINLTSHGFFSLAGIANPTPAIDNLICEINADFYLPIDDTSIPTGEILRVKGTPFDFTTPKEVGKDIDADHEQIKHGAGYDHCFVLNKEEEGQLSFAAKVTDPNSGRTMEVYTTEPGMQFYSDNWADGYAGQHGATFPRRSAVCFEAQHFPDSPNHSYFPSVVLRPGEQYSQKTIYKFGVQK